METTVSASTVPVLAWSAKIHNCRQEKGIARDFDLYEKWPSYRLGYNDVILVTSTNAFYCQQRPRPYYHLVSAEELKNLCPDLHKIVYETYPDGTPGWLPYIDERLRQRDFFVNPGPAGENSIGDMATTVRIFALVNTGKRC